MMYGNKIFEKYATVVKVLFFFLFVECKTRTWRLHEVCLVFVFMAITNEPLVLDLGM